VIHLKKEVLEVSDTTLAAAIYCFSNLSPRLLLIMEATPKYERWFLEAWKKGLLSASANQEQSH
jgi:hypothetical protein